MLWLVATLAYAADPALVLPPGEDPIAWRAPAALAGLRVGDATAPDRVEIAPSDIGWTLRARNGAGSTRAITVAPPRSGAEREDVASLAASLLHALPPGPVAPSPAASVVAKDPPAVRPPAPAAPPAAARAAKAAPVREAPAPVVATAAPVAPPVVVPDVPVVVPDVPVAEIPAAVVAPVVEGAPVDVAAPPADVPVAVAEVPPRGATWVPWASVGPAVAWREGAGAGLAGELALGVRSGAAWLGASVSPVPSRALDAVEAGALATVDVRAVAAWSPPAPVAPWLGAQAGASSHRFADAGETVGAFLVPVVAVEGGAELRLARRLRLSPRARVARDLDRTWLLLPDLAVPLSAWQVEGVVALRGVWE